jgi:hypothetical protein
MSSEKQERSSSGIGPSRLKTVLIALLILSSLGGYAKIIFFAATGGSALPSIFDSKEDGRQFSGMHFQRISSLLDQTIRQTSEPEMFISFNGVLRGETGIVAIVNGEMVVPGAKTEDGIRIIDITGRKLTFLHNGRTHTLSIGETASILRHP